jgi:hypothetical protein
MIVGLVIGDVIWSVIGSLFAIWLLITFIQINDKRVPNFINVLQYFLHSWLGRIVILSAWAEIGWHLFCQKP